MKPILSIVIFCILGTSCSTMRKTLIYSSLSGAALGASAGYALSPDSESRGANAAVFGVVGAGLTALVGYALYEDDPRNKKLKHMLEPAKEVNPNELGIDLGGVNIEAQLSRGDIYKTPTKDLPEKLKGKIKEQYIIKYQSKERYLNKGSKTYYVPSFDIYEHAYDELGGESE